jgi:predicted ABC-type ATPase
MTRVIAIDEAAQLAERQRHQLLEQVRASIPLVDVLRTYDNSSAVDPFVPVFTITNGSLRLDLDPLPAWAAALLAGTQVT